MLMGGMYQNGIILQTMWSHYLMLLLYIKGIWFLKINCTLMDGGLCIFPLKPLCFILQRKYFLVKLHRITDPLIVDYISVLWGIQLAVLHWMNAEVELTVFQAVIQWIHQLSVQWSIIQTSQLKSITWRWCFQLHYQWIHFLIYFLNK
jgi:hypothetical protein